MTDAVIASDLGSSGCKTLAVGFPSGRVLAAARSDYPTAYARPGWAEQDPEDWYGAVVHSVSEVMHNPSVRDARVAAFVPIGVTHTAVLLDVTGQPVAPSILMFDSRSADDAARLESRFGGEIARRTLNTPTATWTWPQLAWVREHQPRVWERVERITFQKDYVRGRLVPGHVTDRIDAAGSLLYDPVDDGWVDAFCEDLGLRDGTLPEAVDPLAVVGEVGTTAAAATGLPAGTPIVVGTTDTVSEMIGSGAVRLGQGIVKLASVGRIAVVSDGPIERPNILNYRHLFDGLWYPGTASKYAASAYRWLRESVWAEHDGGSVYRAMDEAAATAPPGSAGLIFHAHLNGQWAPYWNDDLRGGFLGLTVRHERSHLTRAVLEGVAFSIRDALGELETDGVDIASFRLIGQGSVSALWAQIMADVLKRPLAVPSNVDAAYGGALAGAMAVGLLERSAESVEQVVDCGATEYVPQPRGSAIYDDLFEVYRSMVADLERHGSRLMDIEREAQEH